MLYKVRNCKLVSWYIFALDTSVETNMLVYDWRNKVFHNIKDSNDSEICNRSDVTV